MNTMTSNQHKQIIKSWSGLNEIDVIKMVVADGKHIDLCMNYWSRKRRISVKQYQAFFQDVVLLHINYMLNQCLFNEAEKILNNVKYDIRYAFYQFAVECNNGEIRDMVFKYLQERNPENYAELISNLQINWSIVQCLKKYENTIEDLKKYMQRTDFLSFMNLEDNIKQHILIKLFFKTRWSIVLQQISKCAYWEFLINNQNINEIIKWCHQQGIHCNHNVLPSSSKDDLLIQYKTWKTTNEMYEYGLKILENNRNDVLRNVFAANGYFFCNESNHLHLYRICLTETFVYNNVYINNLNLGDWIVQNQWYYLLLSDATYKEEYNRLAAKQTDNNSIINLTSILRNANIKQLTGFEQICFSSRKCLQQMNFHPKHILFKYWQALTMQTPIANIVKQSTTSSATSLSINLDGCRLPFEDYRNKLEKYKKLNDFNEFHSYDLLKAVNNQINLRELRRIGENFARSYLNDVMPTSTKCIHYIKQLRSSFAVHYWFTGHLSQLRQIPNIRYYATCQNLYNLAIELPPDAEEFCHYIAFCEMLGFDTQPFRCFLHLLHYLDKKHIEIFENLNSISYSKIQFLLANQVIITLKHHSKSFPLTKFKALLSTNNETFTFAAFKVKEADDESRICGTAGYPKYLKAVLQIICYYTSNNDYWSFLILLQYCNNFTLKHMQVLIKSFSNATMRNNLIYAILFKFMNNLLNINHQHHHPHKFQMKNSKNSKANKQVSISSHRQSTFSLKYYPCNQFNETAFRCDGFMYSSFMCKQRMLANVVSSLNCCPDLLAYILSLNSVYRTPSAKQEANITSKQFVDVMQILLKDEEKCTYCNYRHIEHRILDALYCAIHDRSSILAIFATAMVAPDSNNTKANNICCNINLPWCWLTWLTVTTSNCWHPTTLNIANRPHFFWQLIEIVIQAKQLNHLIRSFLIFYPTSALINLFRFLQLTLEINESKATTAIDTLKLYYMDLINGEVRTPFEPDQYNSIEYSTSNGNRYLIGHSMRVLLQYLQTNFRLPIQRQNYLNCICSTDFADHKNIFNFNLLRDFHYYFTTIDGATNVIGDLDFNQLMDSSDPYKYYQSIINNILANKYYNVAVNLLLQLNKPIGDIIYAKWMDIFSEILSTSASCKTTSNVGSTELCSAVKNCDQRYQELIQMFDKCEQEILHYSISPEILVNFLIYINNKLPIDDHRMRYLIFYKTLNIIKHHQLFSYDLINHDQIEFDMIMCYVKIDIDNLPKNHMPLYHSKYFEEVMASEHGILYKSLMELKEMVITHNYNNVDRIKKATEVNSYQFSEMNAQESKRIEVLLNQLLDVGDILQALRLQKLFHITTMEMRWIICSMGLAEKFIDIPNNRLNNEKLFLNDIDNYADLLINQQPPYISDTFDTNAYSDVHADAITAGNSDVHAGINLATDHRQEILRVLQHIQNNKIKHGLQLMNRIVCAYRTAIFLNKDYVDILHTKDIQILLKNIKNESNSQHLLIMRDILTNSHMSCEELTKVIAYEIVAVIIRSQFHNFNHSPFSESSEKSNPKMGKRSVHLWGYNIDVNMQLFLQIIPDATKLGIYILKYCDALKIYRRYQNNKKCDINNQFFKDMIIILGGCTTKGGTRCQNANQTAMHQVISHKKQMFTYVELLIKAHQCFVHECSMEGIANVLHRTKNLNAILAQTKSWSLIIRMLIGIGRYQDMSYCFQSLIENEQFESLLGQFEEDKTIGLRQAILAFLRSRCHQPQQSKELFQLAALHFLMYKDLAEMWQHDAEQILQQIYETASMPMGGSSNADKDTNTDLRILRINPTILTLLHQTLDYYIHAAENYLLDNKMYLAGRNTSQAELIALQIDMANKVSESNNCSDESNHECICILKLKSPNTIQHLVNNKLSAYQSTIVCRVYNYNVSWSEALLYQFVIHLQDSYLNEFLQLVDLNDLMLENIVKSFQHYCMQHQTTKEMEEHLAKLITFVKSITLKYKLASILSLKSVVLSLIHNNNSIYFLRDMNFNTKVNKTD